VAGLALATDPTRTGPTATYECGYCEGQGAVFDEGGRRPCTNAGCEGGVVTTEVRPFVELGAAMEHVQQVRVAMRLRRTENVKPKTGSAACHLDAAEDAIQRLFQDLVLMLPEEYERTEGG
jgi:hypothetical protein